MSTTDCRTLHVYRVPVYQKRVVGIENYTSNPHTRSPSPSRSVLPSGRRHSTPPAITKRTIDINLPPSNTVIKYYYTKPTSVNKEQNPTTDPIKSPPRPISLVKLRHQEERVVRLVTTPTSINSFTDVILPIAKKNRNTIVETPSSNASESQSIKYHKSREKRGKILSLNFDHDIFSSDEESHERSIQDNTCKLKAIKCCHGKCPCRLSSCNFYHWYCNCPLWCWMMLIIVVFALFIGIFILFRF